jgi:hypothetical protein
LQHTSWKVVSVTICWHVPFKSHKNVEGSHPKNKNVKTVQKHVELFPKTCMHQGAGPRALKTSARSVAPFAHDHRTKWSLVRPSSMNHLPLESMARTLGFLTGQVQRQTGSLNYVSDKSMVNQDSTKNIKKKANDCEVKWR